MWRLLRLPGQQIAMKAIAWLGVFGLTLVLSVACSRLATLPPPQNIGSSNQLALGTNLNGVADWSTEVPFLDAFKSARVWIPQCVMGDPDCRGVWETGEVDKLDLDEQGWVKSLPAPADPPEYTRVRTILFGGSSGKFPAGKYVVLYEGEGTIEYVYDATKDEAASKPGRDVIDANFANDGDGIHLIITATDPQKTGNYIRNIRVVPIAYEQTYQTEIFNPAFLQKTRKFSALRFMDWMNTNATEQSEWANRPKVDDYSYAIGKGVPLEIMIELANRLGADPWFNIPHKATDDYIRNFAHLVKQRLDDKLKAYVELSNEVWNWSFPQSHYALEQGKARWGDKGDAFVQWYGMRAAQMADIWKQEFGEEKSRVVAILGTQTAWKGLEGGVLDCTYWVAEGNTPCYQHGDAYAVTGYISGNLGVPENDKVIESWLKDADGGFKQALEQLGDKSQLGGNVKDTYEGFLYHRKVAEAKGLRLVVYEGGQHIVSPQGSDKFTRFFVELNRRPEMYQHYMNLLNSWKQANGTLFVHFSDIAEASKWGSWGALEYVDQAHSPKYDALMDFIEQNHLR